MKKIWDIAVIGGGAAGLAAAIEAKRTAKTLSVLLLEKNASLGRKLAATGNGRCNLSNRACTEQETVLRFFAEAGIAVREEDGRLYPYNEDAREVAAVLTDRARRLGVEIQMNQEIQSMETLPHGGFHLFVTGSDAPVCARKVLIATGGKSYGQFAVPGTATVCANARTQDRDAGAGADGHRDGRGCVFAERRACQGDSRAVLRRADFADRKPGRYSFAQTACPVSV